MSASENSASNVKLATLDGTLVYERKLPFFQEIAEKFTTLADFFVNQDI